MSGKILAAVALLACGAGQVFAAAGDVSYVYFIEETDAAAAPAIGASARGDVAIAWSKLAEDGSRDIHFALNSAENAFGLPSMTTAPVSGRANTGTAGDQLAPALAMDASGNFVIVWHGPASSGAQAIYGQRFSSAGVAVGSEFQVNEPASAAHSDPAVAMDAFGNFTVAWLRTDAGATQILARRYLADGTPLSGEVAISAPSVAVLDPAIAMGAWGEFVVAWEAAGAAGPEVYVRSFAADGTADTGGDLAAALPAQARRAPAVGMDAHGRFVVAWHNTDLDGAPSIQVRQFLAGGAPVAVESPVNQYSPVDALSRASLATDASGDFIVTWDALDESGYGPIVRRWFKQLFAQDGARVGSQGWGWFPASSPTSTAVDADGDAFVAFVDTDDGILIYRWITGPEPVDLALTITEAADPVPSGELVRHTITPTNRHPGSTETGIAEVDSAVGLAARVQTLSLLSGASVAEMPARCVAYQNPDYIGCGFELLPPGSSTSLELELTPNEPGTVHNRTYVYTSGQTDPWTYNDEDEEDTTVSCPEGTGPGTLSISTAPATIEEGGQAVVEVRRTGDTCGTVTVNASVSGDSPTFNASDYSGWVQDTVWRHGEDGVKTFVVDTTDDDVDEDTETFRLVLSQPGGGATLGAPTSATIDVTDNDATPVVTLTAANLSVAEGSSTAMEFTVRLSRRSERGLIVPVTLGGSAQRPADYTADALFPANGQITFGASDALWKTFSFPSAHDTLDEDDETLTFALGTPTYAVLSGATTATGTILDDDAAPSVSIATPDAVVEEGAATSVTLALSAPSGRNVTIPLAWDGSAINGSDFVGPTSATIPAGATSAEVPVEVLADRDAEPAESAVLSLGIPTNAVLGADTSYTLTISASEFHCADGEAAGTIAIAAAPATVAEGEQAIVEIRRVNGACGAVSVQYATNAGGDDFTAAAGTLAWPSGDDSARTVAITTTEDSIYEGPETITFSLSAPAGGAALGAVVNATITLADDDPAPTLSFALPAQSTNEGAGVFVTLQVELSSISGRDVRALLSPSGAARRGQDYSLPNDWVAIPAGSRTASKTVQILNDGVIEMDEQVTFTIGSVMNAEPGTIGAHTITIRDNDPEALGIRETVQGAGGP